MNLTIDIGNSRIKAGIFKGNKLIANCIIQSNHLKTLQVFVKKYPFLSHAIVCTVTDYPKGMKNFIEKKFQSVELSEKTPIPFSNAYKTPATLGKDRLANVAGANNILPGKKVLVINAGTCITYDFIDNKGTYHGGSISPGLEMRFKALHTFTGRLPLVEADTTFKGLTGKTTKESILSGVQQGMIEEILGFIQAYRKTYTGLEVILTGGSGTWLKTRLKGKIISEPLLTLKGLNVILTSCLTGKKLQHN